MVKYTWGKGGGMVINSLIYLILSIRGKHIWGVVQGYAYRRIVDIQVLLKSAI